MLTLKLNDKITVKLENQEQADHITKNLSAFCWNRGRYISCKVKKTRETTSLMKALYPDGNRVFNTLDRTDYSYANITHVKNREESLMFRRKNASRSNTSKYKGVSYDKESGKWRATLDYAKKRHNIGRFLTEEEAALAYNDYALALTQGKALVNILKK